MYIVKRIVSYSKLCFISLTNFCVILNRSVKPESQSAPLTIFYGGRVMVFDDFSAEKAKEVIDLANKGSAKSFTCFTAEVNNNHSAYSQKEIASSPNPVCSPAKTAAQEPIQPNPASLACGN